MIDYYRVLDVRPDAPAEIIRSSYRTLMQSLRLHPDLGGDHERAAQINTAYAVLSDPERRCRYDRERAGLDTGAAHPSPSELIPQESCPFCHATNVRGRHSDPEGLCSRCLSPLHPAERQRLERSLRRTLSRFTREHPLRIYRAWPSRADGAVMRDLSLNGMRFTTAAAIEPERLIKIDSTLYSAVARVTHCGPDPSGDGYSVGVEFVTLKFMQTCGTFVSAEA